MAGRSAVWEGEYSSGRSGGLKLLDSGSSVSRKMVSEGAQWVMVGLRESREEKSFGVWGEREDVGW